ncbi:rhodanese-like domain-containing protein [Anoxybacillus sp. LAT_35]|uniref:rhodanese-like domain-containing protein n=1 Tax=Anoxybacillus TaxID=150247 RepID=UPI001EDB3B3E|nr:MULTISPECIES: rhodanese-like domain-containing protein [Anoxybacillus]MCG5025238.1 rhodanese-like domain-containing protein [Anoxybacillus flavithermus]MCG6199088.1 rhodanese-like domain-containing protein [Anoxybacillus sp. LAT_38]MCG3085054.1 rhodanese-like domain-containing protein [Anoxybacillus sp. LAT27]MCG6171804.1 rhodanese-like domain-containing protein [Anoxybacillus sp. LAT_11]MCG6174943.1 rhodanese-like domain-containing protein [Anoxybacillus sp. LAT_31]
MGTWINVVLIILLIYFVAAKMLPTKGVEHITPDELKEKLKQTKDRQFIDVRTPAEYRARNIRQFKNIPLHQLADQLHELDREKETIVICQSGMRSNQAAKILAKNGFKRVVNVRGGMNAWNG